MYILNKYIVHRNYNLIRTIKTDVLTPKNAKTRIIRFGAVIQKLPAYMHFGNSF